jgi:hypothetical protein
VLFQKKERQTSGIVFLVDSSRSMTIRDMAGDRSRWQAATEALNEARKTTASLGKDVHAEFLRFGSSVREAAEDDRTEPSDSETSLGGALEEVLKRQAATSKLLAVVVMSDGASNSGPAPLVAAQKLRARDVPIVGVGYGQETAGVNARDIAVRELVAGPTVFVKNELNATGTIRVRGFPNQTLDVALDAEGQSEPVATARVKVPASGSVDLPVRDLKWKPQQAGEVKLTLRTKQLEGETVPTNNSYSSFVTVLKGGINVLYLKGPNFSWEPSFLRRALDASDKIELVTREVLTTPGPEFDVEFAPGAYDVYILSEMPAKILSPRQLQLLAAVVRGGAGLMMLGGRDSFGAGGWAGTEIGNMIPFQLHPGDGELDRPEGIKVVPLTSSLENYVLKLGATRPETERIWSELPPIPSPANRFGELKAGAIVLAQTASGDPLLVAQDGKGRVLAFAGETWVWSRWSEVSRQAYLRFWRQAIFWLSHKEEENESLVRVTLDRRRVPQGGKLEVSVSARDSKGDALADVTLEAEVTRDGPGGTTESVSLFDQSGISKGNYFATGEPADYRVTVKAKRNGVEVGSDSARFLVFQDDREMENPAADLALLREISNVSGGLVVAPEELGKYLSGLDQQVVEDYVTQREVRIWDTWPFLLLFTAMLTLEWWLRKKLGWV